MERVDVFRQSAGLPTDFDAQISAKQSKANRADPMRELEQQLGLKIGFLDIHGEPEKHSKQANRLDRSDQSDKADQSKRSAKSSSEETSKQATPSQSSTRHAPYYDDSLSPERRKSPERRTSLERQNDPERRGTLKNPSSLTYEEQVQVWLNGRREPGSAHPPYSPQARPRGNERAKVIKGADNRDVWKEEHDVWLNRVKQQMKNERQPENNQRRGPDVISNNRLEAAFSALENHEISEMEPRTRRYPEKTLPATAVAMVIQRAYGYELRKDQDQSSYGVGLLEDAILGMGWVKSSGNPEIGDIVLAVKDDGTEDAGIFTSDGRLFGIDNKGTTFRYSGSERFRDPKYSSIALYKKIR